MMEECESEEKILSLVDPSQVGSLYILEANPQEVDFYLKSYADDDVHCLCCENR